MTHARSAILTSALTLAGLGCSTEPTGDELDAARAASWSEAGTGNTVLPWAFVLNDPTPPGTERPDPDEVVTVPRAALSLPRRNIRIDRGPPDWHPDGHPPMPEVVARGRGDQVLACGYCHLPNGQGKPENAGLAGQPQVYLERQMADYREGLRVAGEPDMVPPSLMMQIGSATSEEDARVAAAYFASMPFRPWIRVIETDSVPATRFAGWIHERLEVGSVEPIGVRVVEIPEDLDRTKLRDDASGFVAYVPRGSVARGRARVERGGADGVPCTACHGDDLRGLGPMPALAGRSPSYLARQLYDFRVGNRAGAWSPLMAPAVADLTLAEIVDIVAYAASLTP